MACTRSITGKLASLGTRLNASPLQVSRAGYPFSHTASSSLGRILDVEIPLAVAAALLDHRAAMLQHRKDRSRDDVSHMMIVAAK